MNISEKIKYLESLLPYPEVEDKHYPRFEKQARYLGNGVYSFNGVYETNTRALFLMGVLVAEGISYEVEDDAEIDEL